MKKLLLISAIFLSCFSCKNSSDTSKEEEAYPTSKLDMITTLENVDDTASTKVLEEAK